MVLADSTPEWEDPELQREIQAATGIDLKRKGKGKGRGKSSNLTDLRESGSSSRKRLESKIFKRYDLAWIHNYRACESVTTKRYDSRIQAADIEVLRLIKGVTRRDKIRNADI